jgi:hypothetical protein
MRLISRDEARKHGWRRYFTGQPCNAGHVGERYTADATCVDCVLGAAARRRALRSTGDHGFRWARRGR